MADSDENGGSALLTPALRHLLQAPPEERTGATARSKRRNLRERLEIGLLDFRTVFRGLGERDRDRILGVEDRQPHEEPGPTTEHQHRLYNAFVCALAFLYECSERLGWDFELLLEQAVSEVYSSRDRSPEPRHVESVEFNVELSEGSDNLWSHHVQRRAREKFERGDVLDITDRELRTLVAFGGEQDMYILHQLRDAIREARSEVGKEDLREKTRRKAEMFDTDNPDDADGE